MLESQFQFIPGPAGRIEAVISNPIKPKVSLLGIICHPHPLYGGTMNNKVVTSIASAFLEMGICNIRFNFRGIGQSQGSYGEGIGETEDLLAVLSWVKTQYPQHGIWLAGFSFGGYVATRVAARESIEQLITVAPAITHFEFKDHANKVKCPWLLIIGDKDELIPYQETIAWAESLVVPVQIRVVSGASHFFHGKLIDLREIIKQTLSA